MYFFPYKIIADHLQNDRDDPGYRIGNKEESTGFCDRGNNPKIHTIRRSDGSYDRTGSSVHLDLPIPRSAPGNRSIDTTAENKELSCMQGFPYRSWITSEDHSVYSLQ